jgi:phosphopantothenoylcysteine decarboxylase
MTSEGGIRMANIVLGVTGSVAAIRTPELVERLIEAGHELCVVATEASLHFFSPAQIISPGRPVSLYRDRDEWPLSGYRRGDPVLHIDLRRWGQLLVVAPLDAHSLAKFALGLSDNLLTCVFRAWDFKKPAVLAPAMNTRMWDSPVTKRHLALLLNDHSATETKVTDLASVDMLFAHHTPSIVLIPPQSKRLACGDVGIGAMAEVSTIAETVRKWLEGVSQESL